MRGCGVGKRRRRRGWTRHLSGVFVQKKNKLIGGTVRFALLRDRLCLAPRIRRSVVILKKRCLFFANAFLQIFKLRTGTDGFASSGAASWRSQKTSLPPCTFFFEVLFETSQNHPFSAFTSISCSSKPDFQSKTRAGKNNNPKTRRRKVFFFF